jgi:hypothetical protein
LPVTEPENEIEPRTQEGDDCELQPDARFVHREPRKNLKVHEQTKGEPQQNGEYEESADILVPPIWLRLKTCILN